MRFIKSGKRRLTLHGSWITKILISEIWKFSDSITENQLSCIWNEIRKQLLKLPLKAPKGDEEETQEVTTSLAAVKETDLLKLDGIFVFI